MGSQWWSSMGYDDWLEHPYQQAAAFDGEFERFCDLHDFAYDDPRAHPAFIEQQEADAEAAAIRRFDARMDAREYDNQLRGEW